MLLHHAACKLRLDAEPICRKQDVVQTLQLKLERVHPP